MKRVEAIYLWGAGEQGKVQSNLLLKHGYRIIALVDSDEKKWGTTINGISVISPQEFYRNSNNRTIIIITSIIYEIEIIKELEKNNFLGDAMDLFRFHRDYEVSVLLDDVRCNGYDVDFEQRNEVWFNNLLSEVEFWKNDVVRVNSKYYEHYLERVKNGRFKCDRVDSIPSNNAAVLDVGCGICSQYGNLVPDGVINLIGIDPLANYYNMLNKKAGYEEKIVRFGLFELLSHEVKEETVDLILIDNALDHCIDPFRSIVECLRVLKVGGILSMCHHIDEAYKASYTGLHQWNIGLDLDGSFIIWNNLQYINVEKTIGEFVSIETYSLKPGDDATPYGQVVCNIKKNRDIPKYIVGDTDIEGAVIRNAMRMLSDLEYSKDLLSVFG